MPDLLTLNSHNKVNRHEEVYRWLQEQAEKLDLSITLFPDNTQMKGNWLYLPVYIEKVRDAYDNALNRRCCINRVPDMYFNARPVRRVPEKELTGLYSVNSERWRLSAKLPIRRSRKEQQRNFGTPNRLNAMHSRPMSKLCLGMSASPNYFRKDLVS